MNDAAKYDFMPSPSKFYQDKITSSFNLKEINKEHIFVDSGYPRNDYLFNYTEKDCKSTTEKLSIDENKKIILYAPTWRDNEYSNKQGYISNYSVDFDYLQKQLSDEYVIIFKPHYFISNKFNFEKYKGFLYDGNIISDINELYIVADILITDYSSVFFDYLNLRRKIIFFMYDYQFYHDEVRGFYLKDDELPGPIVYTEEELVNIIGNTQLNNNKIKLANEIFNPLEDGNSSKRFVDYVFKKRH